MMYNSLLRTLKFQILLISIVNTNGFNLNFKLSKSFKKGYWQSVAVAVGEIVVGVIVAVIGITFL